MITITRAANGYILSDNMRTALEIFPSLDLLFARLLLRFEGLASSFTGESYGTVMIVRSKPL